MKYSKEYIAELMKYVNSESILVITKNGKLGRLYCPFLAVFIKPIGDYIIGDVVLVTAVKVTLELKDVFIVEDKAYYIIHFRIILE